MAKARAKVLLKKRRATRRPARRPRTNTLEAQAAEYIEVPSRAQVLAAGYKEDGAAEVIADQEDLRRRFVSDPEFRQRTMARGKWRDRERRGFSRA